MTKEVRKQALTIPRTTTMKTPPSLPRSIWALPLAAAPGHGSPCFFTHLRLYQVSLALGQPGLWTPTTSFWAFWGFPALEVSTHQQRLPACTASLKVKTWFEDKDNDYNEHNEEAAMCDSFHLPTTEKLTYMSNVSNTLIVMWSKCPPLGNAMP